MLKDYLTAHKEVIVQRWFELIIETYPEDSWRFFKDTRSQFTNPVGFTVRREIEAIYEELLTGPNSQTVCLNLEGLVGIRAVQDFTPSQAVAPVLMLKQVVREHLRADQNPSVTTVELLEFETVIDRLTLMAFDLFVERRQKMLDIKAGEFRRKTERLLSRYCDDPYKKLLGQVDDEEGE